jgi:hypothetical protein
VIVAGDQRDPTQTAFLQALQEGASMNFMLAQGHRDTQHPTFIISDVCANVSPRDIIIVN